MKVSMMVTYGETEIKELLAKHHRDTFGNAPNGMHWVVTKSYSEWEVEAVEDDIDQPEKIEDATAAK
jgi:hypothetical protein